MFAQGGNSALRWRWGLLGVLESEQELLSRRIHEVGTGQGVERTRGNMI